MNAYNYIRAIDHPDRRNIIDLLRTGSKNVTELTILTRIDQALISQHLRILKDCDLVRTTRDGKWVYYTLRKFKYEKVKSLIDQLNKV